MALFRERCPRCRTEHVTFDVLGQTSRGVDSTGWVEKFEVFAVCRMCKTSTVFIVKNREYDLRNTWNQNFGIVNWPGYVNDAFECLGYIRISDIAAEPPPEHIPPNLESVVNEGSTCLACGCYNAAAAMFRLAIDLASKELLPAEGDIPNARIRRSLGLRLEWLFSEQRLPVELEDLAECIKEDGNDGAHDGTLDRSSAEDVRDFTFALLERLYTYPKRLELAKDRREARRQKTD